MHTKLSIAASLILLLISSQAFAIWVPVTNPGEPGPTFNEFPPGQEGNFVWIDIPDVGAAAQPAMATPAVADNLSATGSGTETPDRPGAPLLSDISCDLEYGRMNFKLPFATDPMRGYNTAAKAKYEYAPDDENIFGGQLTNDFSRYHVMPLWFEPFSIDMLTVGAFYKKYLGEHHLAGTNISMALMFHPANTIEPSTAVDWSLSPQLYYLYRREIGPAMLYGGAFGGYSYSSFSYRKNIFPYAGMAGCGVALGKRFACNTDFAISHQFLMLGAQIPVYLSETFSLTPDSNGPYCLVTRILPIRGLRSELQRAYSQMNSANQKEMRFSN